MSRVVFDTSMSLDGFITAAAPNLAEPMGVGGLCLHEWAFTDRAYIEKSAATLGAVIAGRVTYDVSVPHWGADGPTGEGRVPVFVVTHDAPAQTPANGVYTFVTDGIESALRQARASAGDKDVTVMGGADLGRQYLAAKLVDEIQIHQVPVLLGSGTRMFEGLDLGHVRLEPVEVIDTPLATHLRYRLLR